MKSRHLIVPVALLLAGCSETPVEEMGDEAIAEMESEIQEDAANAAVKVLEEEIDAQLAADGIGAPAADSAPKETGN